jgi:superfamily II DNA/RNA helicase
MLDMGFLPSLRKIEKMLPRKRQTMLFSATMSKNMNEIARSYLKNPVRVEVARAGKTADKVTEELHFIAQADKLEKLLELLRNHHRDDRVLVFGRTKHGMEKLSKKLLNAGFKAGSIHGNKSQPQRDKAIAAFKSGVIRILVATDVAARGLDIPDVKHVYNYELPSVPEAYIHRIGRTARAGKEGAAIAFCSVEEMDDLFGIQKVMGVKIPVVSGSPWGKNESRVEKERIKENKLNEQKKRRESSKTVGRDNKKQINSYIKVKTNHDRPGSKADDGEQRRSDGEIRDDFRPRRKVVGGGSKRRSDQETNVKSGRPQRTNPPKNSRKRFTNTPEWSIS